MNSNTLITLLTIGTLAGSAVNSLAVEPPGILNHQGRIAVSGANWDTTGYFKFALVSGDPVVETLWTNDDTATGTPGGEPTAAIPVTVANGHYAVGLGDIDATSNMTNAVPASVFIENTDARLRTWFSTDNVTFELLSPDRRVTSAGYALSASKAQSVADGSVTAAMLADGAVTAPKLADGAVSGIDTPDGTFTDVVRVENGGGVGIGSSANPLETLTPVIVAEDSDTTGLSNPQAVAVRGNYAYVVDSALSTLQIFDISSPGAIVAKGSIGGMSNPQAVAVQGNFAYVVHLGVGAVLPRLQIFDVSDPDAIVAKDSDGTGLATPVAVAVQGDYAYVADRFLGGTLQVFDVSDPDAIVPKDSNPTQFPNPQSVAVQGDYVYVAESMTFGAGGGVLEIFDVSDPDTIVAKDSDGTGLGRPKSVAVQGDYAYVVDDQTSGFLKIFDVSDPDAIAPKDSIGGLVAPQSVAVQESYAYVVHAGSGGLLEVFDGSDPDAIVSVDSDGTNLIFPRSVAVAGHHACVVDWLGGTSVLQLFEVAPTVAVDGSLQLTSGGVVFADRSVQTRAFGANAVTSSEIADGAITGADFAEGGVGSREIADGSVDTDDLAEGAVTAVSIATGAVAGAEIADNSITAADIGAEAVGTSEIEDGSVAAVDIGAEAVGTSEIEDGSITAADLDASSVGLWSTAGGNVYRGSGNVGIGASAPSHRLDVVGPWDAGVPGQVAVRTHPTAGAFGWLGTDFSGAKIGVSSGSRIDFYVSTGPTATTPLMRLTSAGNLGIGEVFPAGKLHVAGSAGNNTGVWSNFSDERVKKNIAPMASGSLKRLLQLGGMSFDYAREDLREGYAHRRNGWIAQEVEKVFPEWVSEAPDGMKMVTPVGFRALAVEALRELREEKDAAMQTLERKNTKLQRESAALRKRLDSLEKTVARLAAEEFTTEDKRINAR